MDTYVNIIREPQIFYKPITQQLNNINCLEMHHLHNHGANSASKCA